MDSLSRAILQAQAELAGNGGQPTAAVVGSLIAAHQASRDAMAALYRRYCATRDGVPIYGRTFEYSTTKVNAQLANDFFGAIIDTKLGYFMGRPVSYGLDKTGYVTETQPGLMGRLLGQRPREITADENPAYADHNKTLQDFVLRSNLADLDAETGKMEAICGYGARLLYVRGGDAQADGLPYCMAIPPWEVIPVTTGNAWEAEHALRYYEAPLFRGGEWVDVWRAEWYTPSHAYYYVQGSGGDYELDSGAPANPRPHLFDLCPLIAFPNNDERQGDASRVVALIDAYDRAVSDVNSEIEQFRLAYMAAYGVDLGDDVIERARKTGILIIPTAAGGQPHEIRFLTKSLDDAIIEHHLDRLDRNILRFAKSVNFDDEAFGGTVSGIALKFKLFNLESSCATTERKHSAASRRMFEVLATVWRKRGQAIDYKAVTMQFTRNFPLNLNDEAQTTGLLKGLVSEKTRLDLLSFVTDSEKELRDMAAEGRVDLDRVPAEGEGEKEEPTDDGDEPPQGSPDQSGAAGE